MASILRRLWWAFNPPVVEKHNDSLRFGILGAANIVRMALIDPAKSHPEVIVQAVAARDRKKAEAFAKSLGIPEVKDSYQEILDDPNIDVVFIPLLNAFHFEWAARAVLAGKHVLLEKPATSNSVEAEILFNMPELSRPDGPVLMEAFHNRFHPAWMLFRSLVNPNDVVHIDTASMIAWYFTPKDEVHFNYHMSAGSIMSMGTYNFSALRMVFDALPEECIECHTNAFTEGVRDKVDWDFTARFRFPNGAVAEARSTLIGPTIWKPSHITVTTKAVEVPDESLPASQQKMRSREVTLHGFIHAIAWNRIDIQDVFEIRNKESGEVIRKWTERTSHKAYSFREAGGEFADLPGEDWWTSYRYQLEAFVNRVKGRKAHQFVTHEDSIASMRMIDMAYEKSGLGARPTSTYKPE